jgi:hypothetical protein
MRRIVTVMAGAALLASISGANARERVALTDTQLDAVTAGQVLIAFTPGQLIIDVNGTIVSLNGTTFSINGIPVSQNGTTVSVNGTTVSANGTTVSLNGTTVSVNAATVSVNGTVVLSGFPPTVGSISVSVHV